MPGVKMNSLFITGTDTGVGKTIVTWLFAKYLKHKGCNVITQKWIKTGSRQPPSIQTPYVFKTPCSPHLAARIEKRKISADKIKINFKFLSQRFDFVIIEGIGGALVPFNKKNFVIDIVKDLGLPVLVVAGNKLGAINHTLLTIEALRLRKINILGIVFNNLQRETNAIIEDNPRIIKTLTKETTFGVLPWTKNRDKLYEEFIPIGNMIWANGLKKT